jgi:hypothetical protein
LSEILRIARNKLILQVYYVTSDGCAVLGFFFFVGFFFRPVIFTNVR